MSETSLRKQRGNIRSTISRLEKYPARVTPGVTKPGEIVERMSKLRETWNDFHTLHDAIVDELMAVEDPDPVAAAAEEKILENYEDSYYSLIGIFEELIETCTPSSRSSAVQQSPALRTTNSTPAGANGNHNFFYKLPTLSLPKFDGSLTNWVTFKDAFESMIHADETMAPVHKFAYLRDSLVGPAARMIHTLKLLMQTMHSHGKVYATGLRTRS